METKKHKLSYGAELIDQRELKNGGISIINQKFIYMTILHSKESRFYISLSGGWATGEEIETYKKEFKKVMELLSEANKIIYGLE